MTAPPSATVKTLTSRAIVHSAPARQVVRVSTSTDSSSAMGQTAAPTCGHRPGVQAGSVIWPLSFGSQVASTLPPTEMPVPNKNPNHAANTAPRSSIIAPAVGVATSDVLVAVSAVVLIGPPVGRCGRCRVGGGAGSCGALGG